MQNFRARLAILFDVYVLDRLDTRLDKTYKTIFNTFSRLLPSAETKTDSIPQPILLFNFSLPKAFLQLVFADFPEKIG